MLNLKNKIALVTGGGSGINLAFVRALYDEGCKVVIADIALRDEAKEWISSIPSDRVHFHRTDVSSWDQLEAAFDACEAVFGETADIITPGAGIYEANGPSFWKDVDSDSRYKVLDVNLVHPIKATRIAVRRLKKAKKTGVILHVSSIGGQRHSVSVPLYVISKHGINALVRSMALLEELGGIKVVAVAPGNIDTPLQHTPEARKYMDMSKDILLPPEEIAKAMIALITDDKYESGTVLEVCDIGNWREVSFLNDTGPIGPASISSNRGEGIRQVKELFEKDAT